MGMEGEYVVKDGDTMIQYLISYIDTTSMVMVLVWYGKTCRYRDVRYMQVHADICS